jgi:endonuclease G, mitochondrial
VPPTARRSTGRSRRLLERTHEPRPAYTPARFAYPWVDLRPDRLLRSVHSGNRFAPDEPIRADLAVEAARTEPLQEFVRREVRGRAGGTGGRVPRARGRVFTCEPHCNSFRGNPPYADFPKAREAVVSDRGRSAGGRLRAGCGQGPVARATLYFP